MKTNTPEQKKAIANLMGRIKRRQTWEGFFPGDFPRFIPGRTTTEEYVRKFLRNRQGILSMSGNKGHRFVFADRLAPYYLMGDEPAQLDIEEESAP